LLDKLDDSTYRISRGIKKYSMHRLKLQPNVVSRFQICISGNPDGNRTGVATAAAQIGYVPNRAGVRLRTGKTNVLTLVLATDDKTLDYTRRLIQGIGEKIQGTRFHLNVVPEVERSDPVAAVDYILENQTSDGIILTHTSARDPRVQRLMEKGFPFVSHGRTEFYSPHPYHDFNAERYVDLAVERLCGRARKRFLLVPFNDKTTIFSLTVSAFGRAMLEYGASGEVVKDQSLISTAEKARALGLALSKEMHRYDAIVCSSEIVGLAMVSGLLDGGLVLGRDYDMVCRQTTDILPTLYPHMDTLSEDLVAIGRELTDLLIRAIDGRAVDHLQTLHEPIVHWRSM